MGIKKAKTKELKTISAAEVGAAAGAQSVAIDKLFLPERTKRTQLFNGSPRDAAVALVEKLKFEARIL